MNYKGEKIAEQLKNLAAKFLESESNRTSLITVTGVILTDRFTKATILISVFPDDKQDGALDFVRRKRTEFKEYLKKHTRMRMLPLLDFELDYGEKNRQRIDEISRENPQLS